MFMCTTFQRKIERFGGKETTIKLDMNVTIVKTCIKYYLVLQYIKHKLK